MQPLNLKDYRDLDALLSQRLINRVHLVGVELEGGWLKLPPGISLEADSSVRGLSGEMPPGPLTPAELARYETLRRTYHDRLVSPEEATEYQALHLRAAGRFDAGNGKYQAGELPLTPLAPAELGKNLKQYWPDKVNETCGMHVHMSFRTPFTYMRLMEPRYPSTVIEYVKRWAEARKIVAGNPIWPRLRGESRYCQHVFCAEGQSRRKDKGHNQQEVNHRYTVVHYCWERYNTIECRLLPMFDKWTDGLEAINRVLDVTNAYLRATDGRPERLSAELIVDTKGQRIEKHDVIPI